MIRKIVLLNLSEQIPTKEKSLSPIKRAIDIQSGAENEQAI
jgi:hypothetical protein